MHKTFDHIGVLSNDFLLFYLVWLNIKLFLTLPSSLPPQAPKNNHKILPKTQDNLYGEESCTFYYISSFF